MSNRLNRKTSVQLLQTIQDLEVGTVEQGRVIDSLRGQIEVLKTEVSMVQAQGEAVIEALNSSLKDRDAIISALTSTNDKLQARIDALVAAANEAVKPLPILEPAAEPVVNQPADCLNGGCACESLLGGSQLLDPPLKDCCADV